MNVRLFTGNHEFPIVLNFNKQKVKILDIDRVFSSFIVSYFRGFADMPVKCSIHMEKRNRNGSKKYWTWHMKSRTTSLDKYSRVRKK